MSHYEERTKRVRQAMDEQGLDALLIGKAGDCGYLFATPSTGQGLVTSQDNYMLSYFVELAEARAEARNCTVVPCTREQGAIAQVARLVKEHGARSLGFEAHSLSQAAFVSLYEALPDIQLVPADQIMGQVRNVKTPDEIASFRRAGAIDDAAFAHLLPFVAEGVRELDLAAELDYFMRKQGVQALSFPTIVVSGLRSAYCHGAPTSRQLRIGDLVTFDYGAIWEGCPSDITRTVVVGDPTAKQVEVYQTVLEAQQLALDVLRAGVTGQEVDAVARRHIELAGYGDYFGHSLGHALGGGTHLASTVHDQLLAGCIVTVEPGIYIEGWGGVRIEDDALVTEEGCELLTHARKELFSVG